MLTKEQFLASIAQEVKVLEHLHSKVDPGRVDYRPCEGTRNTLELLGYLTKCAIAPAEALVRDSWDDVGKHMEEAGTVTLENFPQRLREQEATLRELLAPLTQDDLTGREVGLPWGGQVTLGRGLVDTSLKFLAAYRLQLFNHIKAAGHGELGTYDAWLGVDAPKTEA